MSDLIMVIGLQIYSYNQLEQEELIYGNKELTNGNQYSALLPIDIARKP
jgi:hypothetical protein